MSSNSPFIRYLLGNLRTSAIVAGVIVTCLAVYAQSTGSDLQWWLIIVVVLGMALSAVANAFYDSRRKRSHEPSGRADDRPEP